MGKPIPYGGFSPFDFLLFRSDSTPLVILNEVKDL